MESLGALVREGHPLFIGEEEEKASAKFMQECERERESICMRDGGVVESG